MVKHFIPQSLEEALIALDTKTYQVIGGGTDLMIQKRSTAETIPKFTSNMCYLLNLKELNYIKRTNQMIHIGAMTTYETLLDQEDIPKLLKEVILDIASPALRYVSTISGNIGNASPAGDSLVYLYALDAKVVLKSLHQERILPIQEVITGLKKTIINNNELIKEIIIPLDKFNYTSWVKVGGRRADAISKVSFIGAAKIENHIINDIRIALGAVYQTVVRSIEIEEKIIGKSVHEVAEASQKWAHKYLALIDPIDDQRSNKKYRQHVAAGLIQNFLQQLIEVES
jgi:xanthine dehydrogenase FAD-binding subunit